MARVPLTEYAAKKLLLGESYVGITITPDNHDALNTLSDEQRFVVKVDAGIKKRGKQGLIALNVAKHEVLGAAEVFFHKGYGRCVVEPMCPHDAHDERYLSIELTRAGARILHSDHGGIEIESHADTLTTTHIPLSETLSGNIDTSENRYPLRDILTVMARYQMSFLEVNPYLTQNGTWIPLDMAALVDSARLQALPSWAREHIVERKAATAEEEAVRMQDRGSQASLNLHTLNPHGSILTLFSGGGASLVAMDALLAAGLQEQIINYSEYSGAPTRDETHAYASTLLRVLFASPAPRKVIVIAGGVANFTDIRETFFGLSDAFSDALPEFSKHDVRIIVRRGGPHQEEGLGHLRDFCTRHHIPALIHDPSLPLSELGPLAHAQLYD